jgi:2-polyprenyl-3-methyl-5-hydroxy-6-metoxy-1,4-benzoquinol methylase
MDYAALYRYRFKNVNQLQRIKVWSPISRFVTSLADSPVRVLDPACGLGEFINSCPATEKWAADLGLDGSTLEKSINFIQGSFFDINLPDAYFDLIFLSNFLEHMKDQEQVHECLNLARTKLRPGGVIIVMGPNFRHCPKEYFDCSDHTVILTHVSVEEHLHTAGFEIRRNVPRFLPYSFRSRLPAWNWTTNIYLKLPFLWRILGKQFLLIATKPM